MCVRHGAAPSTDRQIADALRRFGVSATTRTLVLLRVCAAPPEGPEPEAVLAEMCALVDGRLRTDGLQLGVDAAEDVSEGAARQLSLDEQAPQPDWGELVKVYKLQDTPYAAQRTRRDAQRHLDALVCAAVATKQVAS